MLKELLIHEIKNLMRSKRIIWSVSIFVLLFFVIFTIRFEDFKKRQQNYIKNLEMIQEIDKSAVNYSMLRTMAVHPPVLFSIYHEGSFVRKGHLIDNNLFNRLDDTSQGYSDPDRFFKDSIKMDITILITFFLSLFVFLNTFDSINFEKQAGTLRLLTTFPIRRTDYLAGKIIGMFLFVMLVLGLPYLISFVVLVATFPSLITISFIMQFLIYFFFAELFVIVIILLGMLSSLITKSMRRSLAYVLFFWLFLVLLMPILSYFMIQPFNWIMKTDQKRSVLQSKIYENFKKDEAFFNNYPPDQAPWNGPHMVWNGWVLNDLRLFVMEFMVKRHSDFIRNYYKGPFQGTRESEQLRLERLTNYDYDYEKLYPYFNFFNPVTQFDNVSEQISGSSTREYLNFIKEGIRLRDKLIDKGVNEGWLFSKAYYAIVDTAYVFEDPNLFTSMKQVQDVLRNRAFKFQKPEYEKYQYQELSFGEMIQRSLLSFFLLLAMIVVLTVILAVKIENYDVR